MTHKRIRIEDPKLCEAWLDVADGAYQLAEFLITEPAKTDEIGAARWSSYKDWTNLLKLAERGLYWSHLTLDDIKMMTSPKNTMPHVSVSRSEYNRDLDFS